MELHIRRGRGSRGTEDRLRAHALERAETLRDMVAELRKQAVTSLRELAAALKEPQITTARGISMGGQRRRSVARAADLIRERVRAGLARAKDSESSLAVCVWPPRRNRPSGPLWRADSSEGAAQRVKIHTMATSAERMTNTRRRRHAVAMVARFAVRLHRGLDAPGHRAPRHRADLPHVGRRARAEGRPPLAAAALQQEQTSARTSGRRAPRSTSRTCARF